MPPDHDHLGFLVAENGLNVPISATRFTKELVRPERLELPTV